jgi:hypothetical protein
MMTRFFLVACVALAGCSHEQTVQEGWQVICDAPVRCCSKTGGDPAERATQAAQWILAHLSNPEVRKDFDSLGSFEGDKGAIIAERLRELGMSPKSCAMLR